MPSPKQPKASKAELASLMKQQARVERSKQLARRIFPHIEGMKTVYDAQTVVNAVSGHLQYALVKKQQALKISDCMDEIDLKAGKDSDTKRAVTTVLYALKDEPAEEVQQLADLMGRKLADFLVEKALKGPMSTVKAEEFIAK